MKNKLMSLSVIAACVVASPIFAEGDIKAGKKVFKKCKACHTVKEGKNKVGPTLYKIMDAPSGAVEGFNYSDAMADANLVWDDATFSAFMSDPNGVVPKSKMAFAGLKKQSQIDDLIAYLRDAAMD